MNDLFTQHCLLEQTDFNPSFIFRNVNFFFLFVIIISIQYKRTYIHTDIQFSQIKQLFGKED